MPESESAKALSKLVAAIQERKRIDALMEEQVTCGRMDEYNVLGRLYIDADAHVKEMELALQEAHRRDGIS